MTNTIGDIDKADVILITGSNTTENHPVISTYVKRAVQIQRHTPYCPLIPEESK